MARFYEIKSAVEALTGLPVFEENGAVSIFVGSDKSALVETVATKLRSAGMTFRQSKHRKFKGATFCIALRNTGSAFAANWEFAR